MVSHLVKAVFHLRGKIVVHQIAEVSFQTIGDNFTHFLGIETTVFRTHIAAILNGRNDRRIGRRATDTAFFQLFHQRSFAEACRWLGEVLSRGQLNQGEFIPGVDRWQGFVFIALTQRRHHLRPAIETQNTTTRFQAEITRTDGERGGVVLRWRHLTGDKLAPDQLIQLLRIGFHILQGFGQHSNVGRTNRFVRFLRVLFAVVLVGALRQIFFAEVIANVTTHHVDGVLAQVGRVSTHISNVTSFIQTLSHHHGFLHAVTQTGTCRLLQRGGNKRRARLAAGRFVFTIQDLIAGFLQQRHRGHCLFAVFRAERLIVLVRHFQRQGIAARRGHAGVNFPELFRHKRFDFAFTFDHQTYGNGLYAAC